MKKKRDYAEIVANIIVTIIGILALAAGITYIGVGILTCIG